MPKMSGIVTRTCNLSKAGRAREASGGSEGAAPKANVGPVMGNGIADMLFKLEAAKALYYRSVSEAKLKPDHEIDRKSTRLNSSH